MEAKSGYGEDGDYNYTDFTVDDKSIAYVEYSGGNVYILNYNNFDVMVDIDGEQITVNAMDYVKLDK